MKVITITELKQKYLLRYTIREYVPYLTYLRQPFPSYGNDFDEAVVGAEIFLNHKTDETRMTVGQFLLMLPSAYLAYKNCTDTGRLRVISDFDLNWIKEYYLRLENVRQDIKNKKYPNFLNYIISFKYLPL